MNGRRHSLFDMVVGAAAIVACIAAVFVVPEFRQWADLDPSNSTASVETPAQVSTPTDVLILATLPHVTLAPMIYGTPISADSQNLGEWIIVIGGGFSSIEQANTDLQTYFSAYPNSVIFYRNSDIRTAIVGYKTQSDAQAALAQVQSIRSAAYLRELGVWCPTRDAYNDHIECR
jgi:hypothetical protein